jgi:hypothetical protein
MSGPIFNSFTVVYLTGMLVTKLSSPAVSRRDLISVQTVAGMVPDFRHCMQNVPVTAVSRYLHLL